MSESPFKDSDFGRTLGLGRDRNGDVIQNRKSAAAVQADRAAIETLLRARTQAEPLLTAKALLRILEWPADRLRTLQRHLRAIRSER